MTLTARATKSIRLRDVPGQRSGAIGFQKLVFAHEASGGTTMDLTSLSAPTGWGAKGFVQPSVNQLMSADMKFYRKNLILKSSIRGVLDDYDDYVVTSPTLITFDYTLQAGEIITGRIDKAPMPGLIAVDNTARPMNYTLPAGQVTVPVGWPFEVYKWPTGQVGAVMVFVDGWLQMRCLGNDTDNAGNYQEDAAVTGLGNTITFKAPFAEDRQIMVVPIMAAAVSPSASVIAYLDSLNGAMQIMKEDLAEVTGNLLSRYDVSPSGVDLGAHGAKVVQLSTILLKNAAYTAVAGDQLICDTSSAAFPVTLPATPTVGQRVSVMDAKLTFGTNNLTVDRNGSNIDGAAQNYICDQSGGKFEFVYVDAGQGWTVYKLVP